MRSGLTIALALVAAASDAALVANPSFESSFANWSVPSTNLGVGYAIRTGGVDGVRFMAVSNRTQLSDAPRQNITTSLAASPNGTRYSSRFMAQVDAPASVRCFIQFVDGTNNVKFIMAERMVETTGQWVEVRSRQTVTWQGAPTNAFCFFEIGLMTDSNYPDCRIDGLAIEVDGDGDGLSDLEETNSSPLLADTDSDGLSDAWERTHGFTTNANEAASDDDDDGYSNHQEYWAATDPHDRFSFPGRPANPNASPKARAVLEYLALLPGFPSNRVVIGQHCSYPTNEFTNFITRLNEQTGHWPGLLCMQYDDGGQPLQVTNVNRYAVDYWTNGGLVLIKWQPRNPWTGKQASDTNHAAVQLEWLLDPTNGPPASFATNLHAHTNYIQWVTEAADGLQALKTNGLVVLWRPISEMNGAHFWHGKEKRSAWIGIWRHMYDYFTRVRDLDNLIWVYEADKGPHDNLAIDYFYPGDDVVDVFTHNMFDDTWLLDFDSQVIVSRHPKAAGFAQAGPSATRDGSWSNTVMIDAIQQYYPRCSLIAAWNSFSLSNGAVYVNLAIVDEQGDGLLMSNAWSATREDLAWTNYFTPPSVSLIATHGAPQITSRGGHLEESLDLNTWHSLDPPAYPRIVSNAAPAFYRSRTSNPWNK